jgi:modulator of FtsH protease
MTLLFSAVMATVSMFIGISPGMALGATLAGFGVMMFVLPRFENSSAGIGIVFLATGLLGLGIGPMLSYYLSFGNGPAVVATAMGGTGAIFLGLSAYVLATKKDFSFIYGFLSIGLLVAFVAIIANLFMNVPALSLVISSVVVLLMSGYILFDTSRIINGGETNYIRATMSMFLNIFIMFQHLLSILGIMGDD